jgi:hypothetical protein
MGAREGKTQRCERKFGANPNVVVRHTESGWASAELIVAYVEWLSRDVAKGCPCALVLDLYPSRRTDRVARTAEDNDGEVLFVPAPAIGIFQPLDRRIFGELKITDNPVSSPLI